MEKVQSYSESKSRRFGMVFINQKINKLEKALKNKVDAIVADKSIPYTTARLLFNLCYNKYKDQNKQGEVALTVDLSMFLSEYYSSEEFKQKVGAKYDGIKNNLDKLMRVATL
jgi:hypothetical protein